MPANRERKVLDADDLAGLDAIHAQKHGAIHELRHRRWPAHVGAANGDFHGARFGQEAAVG
jgi:hypothetical protein